MRRRRLRRLLPALDAILSSPQYVRFVLEGFRERVEQQQAFFFARAPPSSRGLLLLPAHAAGRSGMPALLLRASLCCFPEALSSAAAGACSAHAAAARAPAQFPAPMLPRIRQVDVVSCC